MRSLSTRVRVLLATLLTLAAGGGAVVAIAVRDDDQGGRPDHSSVRVVIPAPPGGHAQIVTVDPDQSLSPAEQQADAHAGVADLHEDMRDESPGKPGLSNPPAATKTIPKDIGPPVDLGGAQIYSCPDRYVRNYSARTQKAVMFVLHYTVSVPGSFDAIRRLFDTSSFAASSDFLMELAGRCGRLVPPNGKAWTQLSFNGPSRSVEIVSYDMTRGQWLNAPIVKKGILAQLVADNLKQMGAPPRFVDPVGCTPQGGFTDHEHLECGNNHTDVGKHFPWDVFKQQVTRAYYGGDPVKPAAPPVTPHALAECKQRNRYRRELAAGQDIGKGGRARLGRLERALAKKYVCGRHGPTTVIRPR
jgi:hypothetical protein